MSALLSARRLDRATRFASVLSALVMVVLLTTLIVVPASAASKDCSVKNKANGRTYSTLQAAVSAAKKGAHLTVMGTCRGGTVISKNLTVVGIKTKRTGQPRLSGAGKVRVLDVRKGVRVKVQHLAVVAGRASKGAGIRNRGNLILADVLITQNNAGRVNSWRSSGGGVFNTGYLRLNRATDIVRNIAWGGCGGIRNGGTLVMNGRSQVRLNQVPEDLVGGVCNLRGASLTMNGASAIRGNGEGQVSNAGTVTMNGASWVKPAPGGDDYFDYGVDNGGRFTMNDHSAIRDGNAHAWGAWNGGAFRMNDQSSIRDNGGGVKNERGTIVMTDESSIHDNGPGAGAFGAGVLLVRGTLRMAGNSSITGNVAPARQIADGYDDWYIGGGGGIYVQGGKLVGVLCAPSTLANVYANTPDDCFLE